MRQYLLLTLAVLTLAVSSDALAYPGCDRADILVGGQIWAGCNATTQSRGSSVQSGWFQVGDKAPLFLSYNGIGQRLAFQKKVRTQDWGWTVGPCAKGYRLPTRGDFETAIYYSRLNNTSLSSLLSLPQNGSYKTYKDSDGDVMVESRVDVSGAYWTSTKIDVYGTRNVVLHIGSTYAGHRMDGTDATYDYEKSTWQYDEAGLELVGGEVAEMANVRCIRS